MSRWWTDLAQRERILVTVAAVLTGVIVFWQFLMTPLLNYRTGAEHRLGSAVSQLDRIEKAYMRQRALGFVAQSDNAVAAIDELKAQITQSARDKGLEISRLQGSGSTIGLVINSADPRLVFFWLEDVETRLGARIEKLVLEQAENDRIRVNVELGGGLGS